MKNEKGCIRKCEEKDCDSLRFLYDSPITEAQVHGLMTRMDAIYKKEEEMIIAFTNEEDTLVGLLELYHFKEKNVELGYRTVKQFQQQGYTKNAVKLVCDWLTKLDYQIVAKIHPNNEASKQILQKNGFQKIHTNENEEEYLFEKR